jgi:hypothetical protein
VFQFAPGLAPRVRHQNEAERIGLDRLYLNGYIGKLATGPGLSMFMRFQLGMPVPSPVVLGRVSERFREMVKVQAERQAIPVYQFHHKDA